MVAATRVFTQRASFMRSRDSTSRVAAHFDLITGTSVGGLIALSLAAGKSEM
jgi:patatin-like phospholipase/acyl hydrolase